MSRRTLGHADGRFSRAFAAIKKLLALGFREGDVPELMSRYRNRNVQPTHGTHEPHHDTDRDERIRSAQWAIREMISLGFSETEIAGMIGVDRTTISRALEPVDPRVLSSETVEALLQAVRTAGAERLKLLLPRVAVSVLDTSCVKGRQLDSETRNALAAGLRTDIFNALVFASSPEPLVSGIHACFAQIGDPHHGLYLVKVPVTESDKVEERIDHLLSAEHELEHILERFREERKGLEGKNRKQRKPPSDGRIA